jgi:hypothetical protein
VHESKASGRKATKLFTLAPKMCEPPVLNNLHIIREALNISGYRLDFWKTLFTPAIYCPEVEQEVNDELAGAERKDSC